MQPIKIIILKIIMLIPGTAKLLLFLLCWRLFFFFFLQAPTIAIVGGICLVMEEQNKPEEENEFGEASLEVERFDHEESEEDDDEFAAYFFDESSSLGDDLPVAPHHGDDINEEEEEEDEEKPQKRTASIFASARGNGQQNNACSFCKANSNNWHSSLHKGQLQVSVVPKVLPCREGERLQILSVVRAALEATGSHTSCSLCITLIWLCFLHFLSVSNYNHCSLHHAKTYREYLELARQQRLWES